MAPPAGTLRVGRYFLSLLAVFAVLYGVVFFPGQSRAPKLGLDLQGGTQVIFKAVAPGGKTPSKSSMGEARQIMEQRVNANGVSNSEVVVQGSNRIQISIPGKSANDVANIGSAAKLNFRPVLMPPVASLAAQAAAAASASASTTPSSGATSTSGTSTSGTSTPTAGVTKPAATTPAASKPAALAPSSRHTDQDFDAQPLAVAATTPAATPSASPGPSSSATPTGAGTTAPAATAPAATAPAGTSANGVANPLASLPFPVPTTEAQYTALTDAQKTQLQQAVSTFDCGSKPDDIATKDYLACDIADARKASQVFLLGPVIVPGTEVSSATAQAPGTSQGQTQWTVSLHLKTTGQANWSKWTAAHNIGSSSSTATSVASCGSTGTPCSDFVAFTLDGVVINAPVTESVINGDTSISGGFTQSSATQLANELKYGALPLSFSRETISTVSATLGSGQLEAGLLAGGIGLVLVVVYSLMYYRALGLVTIASLLVSGGLTYACLVVLGRNIGFTLTLAGIAGFIVAVGITADSFVVFFERIKDEVHEGRSMRVAVPRAWVRARRTILSADTVSFLAAATLYYFAAGDVRGFAFTLGLSTVLDLVVVFLFTHPLVSLLSRSAAFGSARFTGLNAAREGGIVPAAEKPVAARRPDKAATSKPAKAAATSRSAKAAATSRPAAVAVLDGADEPVDGAGSLNDLVAGELTTQDEPTEVAAASEAQETESERLRARSAPEPGSAAERAAARRAKLRGKTDKNGES